MIVRMVSSNGNTKHIPCTSQLLVFWNEYPRSGATRQREIRSKPVAMAKVCASWVSFTVLLMRELRLTAASPNIPYRVVEMKRRRELAENTKRR